MSQENVEIARRAEAAFNQRDVEAFAALFATDAEIVPMRAAMEGTAYRGPGGAVRLFADFAETWDHLSVEMEEFRHDGDWVLAPGLLRARGRGSGADVEMRLAWVMRFRDGICTSFRTYTDPAAALADVGVSE